MEYKNRYPDMFIKYKELCENNILDIGKLYLWKKSNKWVLLFPTKKHWRNPSKIEYIEKGLAKFVENWDRLGADSVAFPRLGCGNGGLDWNVVKPLMEKYLNKLPIQILVYVDNYNDPVPEHENITEMEKWLSGEMGSSAGMCTQDNGIKITAEGVLRDSQHISIVYKIERTDGSALDKNGRKCVNVDFWNFKCEDSSGATEYSGEVGTIEQEFGSKHIKYYTTFNCNNKFDKPIDIKLSDIRLWFEDAKDAEDSIVEIEGDWKFSISNNCKDCSINLAKGQELEIAGNKANLEKLIISPMGFYIELTSKEEFSDNKIIKKRIW